MNGAMNRYVAASLVAVLIPLCAVAQVSDADLAAAQQRLEALKAKQAAGQRKEASQPHVTHHRSKPAAVATGINGQRLIPLDAQAHPDHPGWLADSKGGCWVWNPNPQPNESVSWTGYCSQDSRAAGFGTLQWSGNNETSYYSGDMSGGRPNGKGFYVQEDGTKETGDFIDGTLVMRNIAIDTTCNEKIYVALVYQDRFGAWRQDGWWTISPGSPARAAQTPADSFYLYAYSSARNWSGSTTDTNPVAETVVDDKFNVAAGQTPTGANARNVNFRYFSNPTKGPATLSATLTCS